VKLSTFLGEIFQPHDRVEFFHPPREVEYSTFRVEILDHHFKWNFPPFSVTVWNVYFRQNSLFYLSHSMEMSTIVLRKAGHRSLELTFFSKLLFGVYLQLRQSHNVFHQRYSRTFFDFIVNVCIDFHADIYSTSNRKII
jgi:hypothetical protein